MSKEDKEPQTDLGAALQGTAIQPDELIGLISKLGGEKDELLLVKEEQRTDVKPERYVLLLILSLSSCISACVSFIKNKFLCKS